MMDCPHCNKPLETVYANGTATIEQRYTVGAELDKAAMTGENVFRNSYGERFLLEFRRDEIYEPVDSPDDHTNLALDAEDTEFYCPSCNETLTRSLFNQWADEITGKVVADARP